MEIVMEVTQDMELYFKAENVILSSVNLSQLQVAKKYAELYLNQTEDDKGYEVLVRKFNRKYAELSVD
jgi:hypothetical protein